MKASLNNKQISTRTATCSRWFTARGFFYPEDGGNTLLRNVGWRKIYTAPTSQKTTFFIVTAVKASNRTSTRECIYVKYRTSHSEALYIIIKMCYQSNTRVRPRETLSDVKIEYQYVLKMIWFFSHNNENPYYYQCNCYKHIRQT
jgi:hypothetical protein